MPEQSGGAYCCQQDVRPSTRLRPYRRFVMAHDTQLPWGERGYGLQHFVVTPMEGGLHVQGVCPACGGNTGWTFVTGEMLKLAEPGEQEVTVMCAYGEEH